MKVSVYVEGGARGTKAQTAVACRKAFSLFFGKLLGDQPKPHVVASGSREEAYRDFCLAMDSNQDALPILLVDSEDSVPIGKTAKSCLRHHGWTKTMPDEQVHLMVQCMEAWFLADIPAVVLYYDREFKESALMGNTNIEAIPKQDVINRLKNATRATTKGTYDKTRHSFDILGGIDPNRVRQASPHADALFAFLLAKLDD